MIKYGNHQILPTGKKRELKTVKKEKGGKRKFGNNYSKRVSISNVKHCGIKYELHSNSRK